MSSQNLARQQQLEDAFVVFNQVSEQLADSYQKLQERVVHLNEELAAARTDRLRQLAEKERLANRLSHLLDVLPAAVVVLDGGGRVHEFNPAAARLLHGLAPGRPWAGIYQEAFTGERSGDELRLRNGGLVTLSECDLAPEAGRIMVLLDVTETRELQQRLNRRERLSSLGRMAAQLAHQIRTPLASALLDTSNLARDDLSAGRRRQFCERLRARLRHMEQQIKDMLAFARGGQGGAGPVAASPLVEGLGQMLEPLLQARNAGLEVIDRTGGHFFVRGNQDALLGALLNLAGNALEHGGDRLQIILGIAPDASLEIRLCDNGPGIPEELEERVFDPFFTTTNDGTGLGLAVVQSVVLAHEGSISIKPSPLGGACFQLRLPLYRGPGREEAVPVAVGDTGVDEVCSRSLS
ncbi:MAG TPA: PAS domain-containing protein [Sedimenticola sp.]|nr:PAS domain-containing protein [Sedimenticola sp.]